MTAAPRSMSLAFAKISNEEDFSYGFRDFLDRFREKPDLALISDEPASLKAVLNDGGLADAYLASIAAWLARRHGMPIPEWARGSARALSKPWFAAKSHKLRMVLLQESPTEFRVRNLFVSANALSRA